MPEKSIKRRIMDQLLERLSELKNDVNTVDPAIKSVVRTLDPLQASKEMPSIALTEGTVSEIQRDIQGRTYTFEVMAIVMIRQSKDAAEELEAYIAAMQVKMETNIQIDGLAVVMDDFNCEFFINNLKSPVVGAALSYTVRYRHRRGDPYTAY